MANYKAIAAVGQMVVDMLTAAWQNETLNESRDKDIPKAKFSLVQAADFASGADKIPGTGATVFLYRVGLNASCRSQMPRKHKGKSYYPSLPLDLYFLITPWAPAPDTQLYLLGWTMRTLEDIHNLPAASLNQRSYESTFGSHESVGLIFDPLPLADMATLWENLKTEKILPSVTYVVRGILIDSTVEFQDMKPVQTRDTTTEGTI